MTMPSAVNEGPVDAAVDLANQARYRSADGAGPCPAAPRSNPATSRSTSPWKATPSPDGRPPRPAAASQGRYWAV